MRLVALIICLASLGFMSPLHAKSSEMLVENLNEFLEKFGTESGFKLRYSDVVEVSNPVYGDYLKFKQPSVELISGGIRYILVARHVSLLEKKGSVYQLSFPLTVNLGVTPASQPANSERREDYRIRVTGVPDLSLRMSQAMRILGYRLDDVGPISLRIERLNLTGQGRRTYGSGELEIEGLEKTKRDWIAPQPQDADALAKLLNSIRFAVKTDQE